METLMNYLRDRIAQKVWGRQCRRPYHLRNFRRPAMDSPVYFPHTRVQHSYYAVNRLLIFLADLPRHSREATHLDERNAGAISKALRYTKANSQPGERARSLATGDKIEVSEANRRSQQKFVNKWQELVSVSFRCMTGKGVTQTIIREGYGTGFRRCIKGDKLGHGRCSREKKYILI